MEDTPVQQVVITRHDAKAMTQEVWEDVRALATELRARLPSGVELWAWCDSDSLSVKLAREMEQAGIRPTNDDALAKEACAVVCLWPDLIRRSGNDLHAALREWLEGRVPQPERDRYGRELNNHHELYVESLTRNRVAAYRLGGSWNSSYPATSRPCGQTSPWAFAPMARASAILPLSLQAKELEAKADGHTMIPWRSPLPSPFRIAADALANGLSLEWYAKSQSSWSRVLRASDAEFLRGFDDALANGNAAEALIQFRSRCADQYYYEFLAVHERKADGSLGAAIAHIPWLDYTCSPREIELYLVAIGRIPGRLPVAAAAIMSRPDWRWHIKLERLVCLEDPLVKVPRLQLQAMVPVHAEIDEARQLKLHGPGGVHVMPGKWRHAKEPAHSALAKYYRNASGPVDGHRAPVAAWHEGVLHWFGADAPPPEIGLSPSLRTLDQMAPEIAAGLLQSAPVSQPKTVVEALVAGLRSACAPWPEPWQERPTTDEAWRWSPAKCRDHLKPIFECLSQAPIRSAPSNLLATFLYLIADPRTVCLSWPTEIRELWRFKIRTYDHTWILGAVLAPEVPLAEMLKAEPVCVESSEAHEVVFTVGGLRVRLQEER